MSNMGTFKVRGIPILPKNACMWSEDYFVDYAGGSDSNGGLSPDKSVSSVQAAIDKSGPQDTIYIRPRDVTIGAYSSHGYITNVTSNIATGAARQGLSILGTHKGRGIGGNSACAIAPVAGLTTATILVESPNVNIENLLVKMVTGQTAGAIGAVDSTSRSWGLTINNCSFKNFTTPVDASKIAAIMLDNNHWTTIENCWFRECYWGINFGSSGGVIEGLYVDNCVFVGAAAKWEADIYYGDVKNIHINNCRFAHALPAFPTGTGLKYIIGSGANGTGLISNCAFAIGASNIASTMTLTGTILNSNCTDADAIMT